MIVRIEYAFTGLTHEECLATSVPARFALWAGKLAYFAVNLRIAHTLSEQS